MVDILNQYVEDRDARKISMAVVTVEEAAKNQRTARWSVAVTTLEGVAERRLGKE